METLKILVVDDEPVNQMLIKALFEGEGYSVYMASNGKEGRAIARVELPDLILLDIMMPGESGLESCEILKEDANTADIPVIFLSCLDATDEKVSGLKRGAVDYITKPFDTVEVLARAKAQIAVSQRNKSLLDEKSKRLEQLHSAQQSMLVLPADVPTAKFEVSFTPVLEAGGDFYDVIDFGDERVGYLVADVSGHDIGASFITSSLKALFRQNAKSATSPLKTLQLVNTVLRTITPQEKYLTAVYVVLDRKNMRLSLVSAGHPPVVFVPADGEAHFLRHPGDVLGIFDNVELGVAEFEVNIGDRIFLYSDGLLGIEQNESAYSALLSACSLSAYTLTEIVEKLGKCDEGDLAADDIVLLGIEV